MNLFILNVYLYIYLFIIVFEHVEFKPLHWIILDNFIKILFQNRKKLLKPNKINIGLDGLVQWFSF